jgi:hypothetical protein
MEQTTNERDIFMERLWNYVFEMSTDLTDLQFWVSLSTIFAIVAIIGFIINEIRVNDFEKRIKYLESVNEDKDQLRLAELKEEFEQITEGIYDK